MDDSLKILESVNQFYVESFGQLVAITVAVLAFAGVLMPVLISLYQKRLFKLEHEEIKAHLSVELRDEMKSAMSDIHAKYEERETQYEARIAELEKKLDIEVAHSLGGNYHIQGNVNLKEGKYLSAFISLIKAAKNHLRSGKEANLRRALRILRTDCLPNLTKGDLELDDETAEEFDELLVMLEECNENERHVDDIKRLRLNYRHATRRESLEAQRDTNSRNSSKSKP